jgi:hypothetical protein
MSVVAIHKREKEIRDRDINMDGTIIFSKT